MNVVRAVSLPCATASCRHNSIGRGMSTGCGTSTAGLEAVARMSAAGFRTRHSRGARSAVASD